MPSYSEFQASEHYGSKFSGAAFQVSIVDASKPDAVIIGAASGLNFTDRMAASGVEEMGADGVDEWVDERHDGNGSISAFWTGEWNDRTPNRSEFIGREFTVFQQFGPGRPNEGVVTDVLTGVKITDVSRNQAARGIVTVNLSIVFKRRYTGAQWAALAGG